MGRWKFHHGHKDTAHRPVAEALRKAGALVLEINQKDVPDLLVLHRGHLFFLEVKSPPSLHLDKRRGRSYVMGGGKLSPGQALWHQVWRSAGASVHVVRTPEEALGVLLRPPA